MAIAQDGSYYKCRYCGDSGFVCVDEERNVYRKCTCKLKADKETEQRNPWRGKNGTKKNVYHENMR